MLIQSLALSIINYCFKVWGGTSQTLIQQAQKHQNFTAKIAVGKARKYDHATNFLNELNRRKLKKNINMKYAS